jgi:DNA-binding GntR family transcriptional regulator
VQIADDLRRKISAGKYQPGDRLPSLPVMTAEYSSASETVRRALRQLRDEGLVATQSTRGTFVLKAAPDPEADPVARLESEVRDLRASDARQDDELAKLREELEYMQAQVMELGGAAPAQDRDVGP